MRRQITAVTAATVLGLGGMVATAPAASAADTDRGYSSGTLRADINPLNNSGVRGAGYVTVRGDKLHVNFKAWGLLRNMPHAAHIHFGKQARHECPTNRDDKNQDRRLNTAEGVPAYGPIAVSLTTKGDTSPASGLAVDRFDTAPGGKIAYQRGSIEISPEVAQAIVDGKSVVVIHGVDHDGNGTYSGDTTSDLDPSLPTEATDPALCGVLNASPAGSVAAGAGGTAPTSLPTGTLLAGGGLLVVGVAVGTLAARRNRATV